MLPTALALADLPDPATLADALRKLADDRYQNDGLTLVFINTGPMSEPLKHALHHAITQATWASASRQLELHPGAHHRPIDLDPRLGPQSHNCSGPRTTTGASVSKERCQRARGLRLLLTISMT